MKYCTLTLWGTADTVNATLMTARQQGIPFLGGWTKTNTPSRTYMSRVAVSTGTVGVRVRLRERDRALFSLNAVCRVVPTLDRTTKNDYSAGMSNGIPCGGTTVFARGGVIAEAHERQHFRVDLIQIASDGREVNLLPLVNPATIFNALRDRGLVFSGPAPLDTAARCMRFMFEKDAQAFYEAFKEA